MSSAIKIVKEEIRDSDFDLDESSTEKSSEPSPSSFVDISEFMKTSYKAESESDDAQFYAGFPDDESIDLKEQDGCGDFSDSTGPKFQRRKRPYNSEDCDGGPNPKEGPNSTPFSFLHNEQNQLWQFLIDLLLDESNKGLIQWTKMGEFRLLEPHVISKLWGQKKNRPNMNYEKLSRGLRYYYAKHVLQKVPGIPYGYRFENLPADTWKHIVEYFRTPKSNVVPYLAVGARPKPSFSYRDVAIASKSSSIKNLVTTQPNTATRYKVILPRIEPLPVIQAAQVPPPATADLGVTAVEAVQKCLEHLKTKKELAVENGCEEEIVDDREKVGVGSRARMIERFCYKGYKVVIFKDKSS